ncbi:hypothetical protein EVA_07535 [gut metagenome]|uniref:DUF3822 domain-containing protein n=1 Tax=gut metagenome TaxID=749906 RepID=J9CVV2_9ZZZZ
MPVTGNKNLKNIDFTLSEQYTLSIRLSTDGFSFSVFNPHSDGTQSTINSLIDESISLTANLKQTFRELDWLNHSFHKVNILVANRRYTFIPLEFFEDEQAECIFYHNHSQRENELIQYNILHKNNIVVLFGMDKSSHSFLLEQFPQARFYAQASPFINYLSTKSRLGNNRKLYAHIHHTGIDMYSFERGRLLLGNSFECKETTDLIYYLLYGWKQLDLDQEHDELHLCGLPTEKEKLLTELKKYIRQVFIMPHSENIDLQAITSLGE